MTTERLDGAVIVNSVAYNSAGQLTTAYYPNGPGQAGNGTNVSRTYDERGRVGSISGSGGTNSVVRNSTGRVEYEDATPIDEYGDPVLPTGHVQGVDAVVDVRTVVGDRMRPRWVGRVGWLRALVG